MINDFYARSGIPPGTKVRLSAQLDGLTEQWVSEQYMTMMKSTYFSDIPVMMKVGKFLPRLRGAPWSINEPTYIYINIKGKLGRRVTRNRS